MRQAFVHEAVLTWAGDDDDRAPGGAVTEELCGSIDHQPPCLLAPHFTSVVRRDETLEVRVLFACESADEAVVRSRIDTALGRWPLVATGATEVRADEADHAARLASPRTSPSSRR